MARSGFHWCLSVAAFLGIVPRLAYAGSSHRRLSLTNRGRLLTFACSFLRRALYQARRLVVVRTQQSIRNNTYIETTVDSRFIKSILRALFDIKSFVSEVSRTVLAQAAMYEDAEANDQSLLHDQEEIRKAAMSLEDADFPRTRPAVSWSCSMKDCPRQAHSLLGEPDERKQSAFSEQMFRIARKRKRIRPASDCDSMIDIASNRI